MKPHVTRLMASGFQARAAARFSSPSAPNRSRSSMLLCRGIGKGTINFDPRLRFFGRNSSTLLIVYLMCEFAKNLTRSCCDLAKHVPLKRVFGLAWLADSGPFLVCIGLPQCNFTLASNKIERSSGKFDVRQLLTLLPAQPPPMISFSQFITHSIKIFYLLI